MNILLFPDRDFMIAKKFSIEKYHLFLQKAPQSLLDISRELIELTNNLGS